MAPLPTMRAAPMAKGALIRSGAWCAGGLVTALLVWAVAALFGHPEVAPWVDLVVAALALVFAGSLFTGAYLGRPHVTYLDDNYRPLVSVAGGLRLVLFAVMLIVAAFVTAAAVA